MSKRKETVVAKVNAEELFESQLDRAVKNYNQFLKDQGIEMRALGQDQMHKLRHFMLQKMVERELLHQEALKKKLKVSKEEIDKVMETSEASYPTHQDFLDDVLEEGETIENYRERVAYDMLVNTLTARRYEERKKPLLPEAIQQFYQDNTQLFAQPESVKIGHILIKVDQDADNKTWEKAKKKLLDLKKSKKDFRILAKEHSECPSAQNGGDLGFIPRGRLFQPLEITAFKLQPNQISQPIESNEGVHLIKLYERRPQGFIPPFEEIKDLVEQAAKTDQAQRIYQEYIEEIQAKSAVKLFNYVD
ncbi:MAG: peptidylprolyl isomerase [Thermodesulfobacteriota bacterium]|nr:peptidylprolyl isomerase [Thermodesulfobacteriota bacterium]